MAAQLEHGVPYALAPDAGARLAWFSSQMTLKASAPELGAIEAVIPPGDEPPLHVHSGEDEWFYLIEGEVTFHVGDQTFRESAGAFVSFPRGIAHTFTVESSSARLLIVNTPGGFERMFERGPKSVGEAMRAMGDFGMEVVGPHPRDAARA
jgi:quercetin dioxygenase-like cupin family protein